MQCNYLIKLNYTYTLKWGALNEHDFLQHQVVLVHSMWHMFINIFR
uniref:Uncharacterized protein n=1 Tax=Amphimedon queenslandica TaxID=400682 RepID=A0A1X7TQQ7_AMPQE